MTDEQRISALERQVAELLEHNRALLNFDSVMPGLPVRMYEAINKLEAREYPERVLVVRRGYDVKMTKFAVNESLRNEIAEENTFRMNKALTLDKSIEIPTGLMEIKGQLKANDRKVNIQGYGNGSIIRQYEPVDTLLIDMRNGRLDQPVIRNICFEADSGTSPFASGSAIHYLGYSTQDNPDRIYGMPGPLIENVTIKGKDNYRNPVNLTSSSPWQHGFYRGIILENCNVGNLTRVIIQGNGAFRPNGTIARTIGIELIGTRASIENGFYDVTIYNFTQGVVSQSTTFPGIEGLKFYGLSIAGVIDGVVIRTSAYGAPGYYFIGGHIAASRRCFDLKDAQQGKIMGMLLYHTGNNLPRVPPEINVLPYTLPFTLQELYVPEDNNPSYIKLWNCHDWTVSDNSLRFQPPVVRPENYQDPYGILVYGEPGVQAVENKINNNFIQLDAESDKPHIWFQGLFSVNNTASINKFFGGGAYKVLADNPNNTAILGNYPKDSFDTYTVAVFDGETETVTLPNVDQFGYPIGGTYTVTRTKQHKGARLYKSYDVVSGSNVFTGHYTLDLYSSRATHIILPNPNDLEGTGLPVDTYSVDRIVIQDDRKYTLQTDIPITLIHNLSYVRLHHSRNLVTASGDMLTFTAGGERVEQIGSVRNVPTLTDYTKSQPGVVQLLNQQIKTDIGLSSGEHYYSLTESSEMLGGITYRQLRAVNLFRKNLTLVNFYTGAGWSGWELESNLLLQSSEDPTNSEILSGQIKVHRNTNTGKKFIWWNDNGTLKKLNLSADFVGYSTGLASNHGPMVYDELNESMKRTGWNDFAYQLKTYIDSNNFYLLAGSAMSTVSGFSSTHKEVRFDTATGQLIRLS